jgi:hypothetical protein
MRGECGGGGGGAGGRGTGVRGFGATHSCLVGSDASIAPNRATNRRQPPPSAANGSQPPPTPAGRQAKYGDDEPPAYDLAQVATKAAVLYGAPGAAPRLLAPCVCVGASCVRACVHVSSRSRPPPAPPVRGTRTGGACF